MNMSLQDVRNLGYKKVYLNFCDSLKSKRAFFSSMEKFNMAFCSFKMPSYSFMNYWNELKDLDDSDIRGFKYLMLNTEPLISVNEPSASVKRKFRNTWDMLWNKFGEVNGLEVQEIAVIKEVGLKIPIFLSAYELGNEKAIKATKDTSLNTALANQLTSVCMFYNTVLCWYIQTQSESILQSKEVSLFDLVSVLCITDNSDFVIKIESGDSLWD